MSEMGDNNIVVLCDDEFNTIITQIKALREVKNHDYANSFVETYNEFGLVGVLMDLGRKTTRIKMFAQKGVMKVKDENMDDTLRDLALLAINALIWWRVGRKK